MNMPTPPHLVGAVSTKYKLALRMELKKLSGDILDTTHTLKTSKTEARTWHPWSLYSAPNTDQRKDKDLFIVFLQTVEDQCPWHRWEEGGEVSHSQIDRLERITDVRAALMNESLEMISMSDTNLSSDLLLHGNTRSQHEKDLKPTAKHYSEKILTREAIIVNDNITHVSSLCPDGCIIDHITTTNPAKMTPAITTTHPSSDQKVLSTIHLSAEPIDGPKYTKVHDYKNIDKFQFRWYLRYDEKNHQAVIEPDPSVATHLLQSGILGILNQDAPARII